MTTGNLIAGIYYIQTYAAPAGMFVTAIQFEDGSGYKFNYQLYGCQDWLFIEVPKGWMNSWIKTATERQS
jgi:hypothetical protein